ncbi:uncharacterized protein BXZ73DRAFT_107107 [Epithele typhae]|uniref:uncharacterized protein n=1 Tax=Epithele typhae TaxID=378194 RepID=UPI002007D231|nr:uncharacterized protein BXZ73DRAFT_107107 [Epithele typhae]KAH9912963.1 hypothetical protein BXZ73DRAFT_107107 [Epithele typhae]
MAHHRSYGTRPFGTPSELFKCAARGVLVNVLADRVNSPRRVREPDPEYDLLFSEFIDQQQFESPPTTQVPPRPVAIVLNQEGTTPIVPAALRVHAHGSVRAGPIVGEVHMGVMGSPSSVLEPEVPRLDPSPLQDPPSNPHPEVEANSEPPVLDEIPDKVEEVAPKPKKYVRAVYVKSRSSAPIAGPAAGEFLELASETSAALRSEGPKPKKKYVRAVHVKSRSSARIALASGQAPPPSALASGSGQQSTPPTEVAVKRRPQPAKKAIHAQRSQIMTRSAAAASRIVARAETHLKEAAGRRRGRKL